MSWLIETIDSGACQNNQIALDATGTPHAVYVTNAPGISYSYRDGSGWHNTQLSADATCLNACIAARDDQVHVAWSTAISAPCAPCPGHSTETGGITTIHHAFCTAGGGWTTETAVVFEGPDEVHPGDTGWNCVGMQIAIDSDLSPHIVLALWRRWHYISYAECPQDGLFQVQMVYLNGASAWAETDFDYRSIASHNATEDSNNWLQETMGTAHSLAADSIDVLHVAWRVFDPAILTGGYSMMYANSGDGWTPVAVGTDTTSLASYSWPALAVDSDGIPAITYGRIKYARSDGGWTPETLSADGGAAAVGFVGNVAKAAYYDGNSWPRPLTFADRSTGSWVEQAVSSLAIRYPDIACSPIGAIHIIFGDVGNSLVKYALLNGRLRQWWT
jgi:hypothetical protein